MNDRRISIMLGDSDWQDVAECLAFAARRRQTLPSPERAEFLQRELDRQLTVRRLAARQLEDET